MSRLAKKPINIPAGVNLTINGQTIVAKGSKGELQHEIHDSFSVEQQDNQLSIVVKRPEEKLKAKQKKFLESMMGTTRALINNILVGVSQGFEKKLLLVGVGYRAQKQGNNLNLSLGFSHPVVFAIPEGIDINLPAATEIVITGINKQLVGQVAANIRAIRPVEPYKGKGVRYSDEQVILKETKKK